jgi:hypothetical protein
MNKSQKLHSSIGRDQWFIIFGFFKCCNVGPGMVANSCNPSLSGGRDQEDCDLRPAEAKKLVRLHLNK